MGQHGEEESRGDAGRPTRRVALYCRVSTRDQSCERQERDLATFAKRTGFEVVGVFKVEQRGEGIGRVARPA